MMWCPTREGVLAAQLVSRENLEESSVHIWMLRTNEAQKSSGSKGAVRVGGGSSATSDHIFHHKMTGFGGIDEIADFAWHPTDEERLIAVSAKDNYRDVVRVSSHPTHLPSTCKDAPLTIDTPHLCFFSGAFGSCHNEPLVLARQVLRLRAPLSFSPYGLVAGFGSKVLLREP